MQDVTAEIAYKNREKQPAVRKSSNGNIALQHCYGQIGISAVAAALRYQSDRKNPRYARIDPLNADTTQFAADAA